MSDLVKRLETKSGMIKMGEKIAWGSEAALMDEAAARITALEAENKRLREALTPFAEFAPAYDEQTCWPPSPRSEDGERVAMGQWGEAGRNVRAIFVGDLRRAKAAMEGE